uniref:Fibroblast growth factor receptor 3-like n=1 Tax=Saccoglossus kowalevskii TaxID=10224 RepID=A0ABM0M3M9_SACKO|nr:PREDICTED: fibroblast growth factor receptor 3-like [Saccoglossus kowalevskii]
MVAWQLVVMHLYITASQWFSVTPENTTAIEGDPWAMFECTVSDKEGSLYWKKGSLIIYDEKDGVAVDPEKHSVSGDTSNGQYDLTIYDIVKNDDDSYTCEVSGVVIPSDAIQATAYLTVYSSPEKVVIIVPDTVTERDTNVEMMCVTHDPRNVTYSWFKDGIILKPLDSNLIMSDEIPMLVIKTVLRSHSGYYTCMASNIAGSQTSEEEFLEVYFQAWSVSLSGPGETTKTGEALRMTCITNGSNHETHLNWYKDRRPLQEDEYESLGPENEYDGAFYGTITTQDLHIAVQAEHNCASYQCEGNNTQFTDTILSNEETLYVYYPPIIENRITNSRCAANLTGQVNMICEINSNPESVLTWLDQFNETLSNDTGKMIIREQNETVLKTSILTIMSVEESDFGEYYCVARNYIGSVIHTVLFSEISSPDSVTDVRVINKTDTSISLTWIPGFNGGEQQVFYIAYKESLEHNTEYTAYTTNPFDTIFNLKPSTEYPIIVVSKNKIGETRSESIVESTLCGMIDESSADCAFLGVLMLISVVIAGSVVIIVFVLHRHKRRADGSDSKDDVKHFEARDDSIYTDLEDMSLKPIVEYESLVKTRTKQDLVDKNDTDTLLMEIEIMKRTAECEHLVAMMYCNIKTEPYFMALEYPVNGLVSEYMADANAGISETSLVELTSIARDVSSGMSFLERKECVIRIITLNNIYIDRQKRSKIFDLGFSSSVMDMVTFKANTKGCLPIKWLSLESVLDQIFTSKSDVWSYGVVLWEIFSLGDKPFPNISGNDFIRRVQRGLRLKQPKESDSEIYNIMMRCWAEDPSKRPTFDVIEMQLENKVNKIHEGYHHLPKERNTTGTNV